MRKRVAVPKALHYGILGLVGVLLLIILACGEDATATPIPTATPTQPAATVTPQPTATPIPTATPTSLPGVTPEPTATSTPRPTATSAPTATPRPTATPIVTRQVGKRGGNPPLHMGWSVRHWDPQTCTSPNTCMTPFGPLYDTLFEFNPETDDQIDIRGHLVKEWELSDDGTKYTFVIHDNVRFHDGHTMDSEDVVWSLDSMSGKTRDFWPNVRIKPYYKGSRAIDANTIEMELNFPTTLIIPHLSASYAAVMPKHHFEGMSDSDRKLKENINGSGPYTLVKYDTDVVVEYTRNNDWFQPDRPYWDGMRYFIIVDPGAVNAAFKAGNILYNPMPTNNLSAIQNMQLDKDMEGKGNIWWAGPTAGLWQTMNTNKAPFSDPSVRRALDLATHRQPILETFGGIDLMGGPFPPDLWFSQTLEERLAMPGYRETADGEKHPDDLAEANRLLDEAGFEDRKTFPKIDITSIVLAELPENAQIVAQQWREWLGLDVEFRTVDFTTALDRWFGGEFHITSLGYSHAIMEPDDIIAGVFIKGGRANFQDWSNPVIEQLYLDQGRAQSREERLPILREIEQILLTEASPYVLTQWTFRGQYVDNRIKNYHVPNSDSVDLRMAHMWCDPGC